MTDEQKRWIDNASYEELLRKWRFTPSGDPIFTVELRIIESEAKGNGDRG